MHLAFYLFLMMFFMIGCQKNDSRDRSSQRQIQVMGSASRLMKPDLLKITVIVNLQEKNMKVAKDRIDFAQGQVWQALEKLSIPKKEIEESGIQFQRQMDYNTKQLLYYVSNSIQFKIKDFTIYDSLVNALTTIPDVNLNPPQSMISNEREIRDQVRSEAVLDARKKAESMLKPLNLKLGKPLLMTESGGMMPMHESRMMTRAVPSGMGGQRPEEFAAGNQEIMVEVNVSFEIEE